MKLHMIHCGYYDPEVAEGVYEFHVDLFAVAETLEEAEKQIRSHPNFIAKKMHIDGSKTIETVGNFQITPTLKNLTQKALLFLCVLLPFACSKKENFPVSSETVAPSTSIDWLGTRTALLGEHQLEIGKPLPPLRLRTERMEEFSHFKGPALLSVVPSLDTEVCEVQTHELGENPALAKNVQRYTVSRDLPYALQRFRDNSKIKNVQYLSDYQFQDFGRLLGLTLEKNNLLARALIVIDKEGIVRHFQINPKIYTLPDFAKAIAIVNHFAEEK